MKKICVRREKKGYKKKNKKMFVNFIKKSKDTFRYLHPKISRE